MFDISNDGGCFELSSVASYAFVALEAQLLVISTPLFSFSIVSETNLVAINNIIFIIILITIILITLIVLVILVILLFL